MNREEICRICQQKTPEIRKYVSRYVWQNPRAASYREDMVQECFEALIRRAAAADSARDARAAPQEAGGAVRFSRLDCLHVCSGYFHKVLGFPKRTSSILDLLKEYDKLFGISLDAPETEKAVPCVFPYDDLITRIDFERFVAGLDPFSRWIIIQRHMGRSMSAIARDNHVTRGRIRQIIWEIRIRYASFQRGEGGGRIGQAI